MQRPLDVIAKPIRERLKISAKDLLIYIALFAVLSQTNVTIYFLVALGLVYTLTSSFLLGLRWSLPVMIATLTTITIMIELTGRATTVELEPLMALALFGVTSVIGGAFGSLLQMIRRERDTALQAIAERDQALSQLSASEKRYRLLVEGTSDVAYLTDIQGNFTYASPSALLLTGYDADALIGQHFSVLIAPEWQQKAADFYMSQFRERTPETVFEFPIITPAGATKWVEQTVALLVDGARVNGFNAIVRNITVRKRLETDLVQARDEALRASEFKSHILANVSHDARTPLGSIVLVVDMLLRGYFGELTEKQCDKLQTVMMSAQQLTDFISNLLDKAQIESGSVQLHNDVFEPYELTRNAENVLKPLVEQQGLEFETSISADFPDVLEGDLERLRQILYNLVTNAIKFTDTGKITVNLLRSDDTYWALQVADTGVGIAKDNLDRIFDPFWQVDGSRARKVQEGVGLGLSIVAELAHLMGGDISAESEEGAGTSITVTLPYQAAPADEVPVAI